jgi:hypothetical protein
MARQPPDPGSEDVFSHIDLRRAKLCLDCEAIFQGLQCPACTSESFVPITRWIRPSERPQPLKAEPPPPPPASKPRRLLRKSLYLGLGAYGAWKMLFEPPRARRRKPKVETESGEGEGPSGSPG